MHYGAPTSDYILVIYDREIQSLELFSYFPSIFWCDISNGSMQVCAALGHML